jgi:hypothetical protein
MYIAAGVFLVFPVFKAVRAVWFYIDSKAYAKEQKTTAAVS